MIAIQIVVVINLKNKQCQLTWPQTLQFRQTPQQSPPTSKQSPLLRPKSAIQTIKRVFTKSLKAKSISIPTRCLDPMEV